MSVSQSIADNNEVNKKGGIRQVCLFVIPHENFSLSNLVITFFFYFHCSL